MSRPIIGIGAHSGPVKIAVFDKHATFVPQEFVDRLAAVGCTPVLLPPLPGAEDTVGRLDGLVLLAGPDVDPAAYAAERHPEVYRVDPGRDAAELAFIDVALSTNTPVLGICRGLQLLNVFRKGTLHQHLPDILHHTGHMPKVESYGRREVRLTPGSRLARILGDTTDVPCHHHQAVDQLGVGLVASALATDGTIEAAEVTDHPFAIGVQWHAESSPDNRLFEAFAEAARTARTRARQWDG